MTATCTVNLSETKKALYVAFELGWTKWTLAFTTSPQQNPRLKNIKARDLVALQAEIAKAKVRFGLDPDTPVFSCYEAGRDGFWLHRYLVEQRIDNRVVDSSSIEVKRHKRRAKSDRVDVGKLLGMLLRYHGGEKKVWSVVQVASVADEDRRQLHRELLTLKGQRTECVNRIKGLLASHGVALEVGADFATELAAVRLWDGSAVPAELHSRLLREFARWQVADKQIHELEKKRLQRIREAPEACHTKVRKLLGLKAIGVESAWLFTMEFFAWRVFRSRRQVAALAGLTPTPYDSGTSSREQGISKAGNRRLRAMAIEIAWSWLRFQPDSHLSKWYRERFAKGTKRERKIGIVALARKLLVALWRYVEQDEVPEGAVVVSWESKLRLARKLDAA